MWARIMYSLRRYLRNFDRLPELVAAMRVVRPYVPLALEYLGYSGINYPMHATVHDQLNVRLEESEDARVLWHIFVRHCYPVLQHDRVILDAGANIGLFAMYAAFHAPAARIFSMEPLPLTFRRLQETIESNRLASRVSPIEVAITGAEEVRFIAREKAPSARTRLKTGSADPAPSGVKVNCRTLASIIDEYGLETIDLLKMDIEGSEFEALLATPVSILKRIDRIALEVHGNQTAKGYRQEALLDHLRSAGSVVQHAEINENGNGIVLTANRRG